MSILYPVFYEDYNEDPKYVVEAAPGFQNLRIGTQLHGGFAGGSLYIPGDTDISYWRYRNYIGSHCVVFDPLFRRAYEGAVDSVEIDGGGVNIQLVGYYLEGDYLLHGNYYPGGEGSETYAHNVIRDAISLTGGLWSPKVARISTTDMDLDEKDYTGSTKIVEAVEDVLKYGHSSTSLKPAYFAIYDHRIARFFPEPELNYLTSTGSYWFLASENVGKSDFKLSLSRQGVFNKVWYLWDNDAEDGVGPTLSESPYENKISQKMFRVREGVVDIGGVPESVANMVRNIFISRRAFPRSSFGFSVMGITRNQALCPDYLHRIRAGDIITVRDFGLSGKSYLSLDGYSASGLIGFVIRTEYDYDNNRLSLEVGTDDKSLDIILARWGVSGGIS